MVLHHSTTDSKRVKRAKEDAATHIASYNKNRDEFDPFDIREIKALFTKVGYQIDVLSAGEEQVVLEDRETEELIHATIGELLLYLGIGVVDADTLLGSESVKLRLLLWCLCPRFAPYVEWADVEVELEVLDVSEKLQEVAVGPGKFLAGIAAKNKQTARLAGTDSEGIDSELASIEKEMYNLSKANSLKKAGMQVKALKSLGVEQEGAENSVARPSKLSLALNETLEDEIKTNLDAFAKPAMTSNAWDTDTVMLSPRRLPPLDPLKCKEEAHDSKDDTLPFGMGPEA
jgi:hypothetical protein